MSTAAIVVIVVVVVLVLVALLVLMPRVRERARVRKQEGELERRRDEAAGTHRAEAEDRERQAEQAERRARIAEQEAQRDRAEAQLKQEQAAMHERGLADDQLIGEHERGDFAGTSADPDAEAGGDVNGRAERTSAYGEGRRAAHDPARAADYEEGRNREQ
jgi:FtsZ-interacting cell division protein ZipA